jgi:SSS family solute:Na+ symporter
MLEGLPNIIIGIVIVLVLSASMSTLSSLVLTSSSTLTLDLLRGHIVKKMSDKKQVLIMRILTVVFIIISAVIALNKDKLSGIAEMMGISWGALAGAFLAPFLFGLYFKRTTKAAVWTSFGVGVGVMVMNMIFDFPSILKSPINCGVLVMLLNLILVPLISLITPKPKREKVDEMFACYEKEVVVSSKESLGK